LLSTQMRAPVYVRRDSDSSLPIRRDSRDEDEEDLEHTGLRKKKLCFLITVLLLLALFSLILLALNIMIIRTLEMSHQGMRLIKFYKVKNPTTGEEEKMVQFGGREMDLNKVVASSGRVQGTVDSDLNVYGSRVVIQGEPSGSRMILQEGGCVLDGLDDFQIISSKDSRPVFSARHPLLPLDKKIKRISSSTIITNKVRSAVNERLRVGVEDISIRGNEAVFLNARAVHMASGNAINFNTTRHGSLHLRGSVFIGGSHSGIPLSQSPSLSASIEAFRLCVCSNPRPILFTVPGNKPCVAPSHICA
ncbi:hypothetical protein PFISCL1PPCAC_10386, partial [Pristionchus fissidentatus]